jgi:hypothetical protein
VARWPFGSKYRYFRLSESAKIAAPAAPDPTELEIAGIVFTPLLQLWLQLRGRPLSGSA